MDPFEDITSSEAVDWAYILNGAKFFKYGANARTGMVEITCIHPLCNIEWQGAFNVMDGAHASETRDRIKFLHEKHWENCPGAEF